MPQHTSQAQAPRPGLVREKNEAEHAVAESVPLVLVVDDDAEMRAYVCRGLRKLACRVAEAADGGEALLLAPALVAEGLVLVITDIVMPGLDGLALKAALGADPALCGVPVLLITGEALRVGEGPVLRKPFNTRSLHARVQDLLSL